MLAHLLGLVLGVEDGQLGEHPHVGPLQAQGRFQQLNELLEVAAVLVVVDELLQLVRMHHNVQPTHLGQAELLVVHTCEAHLFPCLGGVGFTRPVHGSLVLAQVDQRDGQPGEVGYIVVQELGGFVHLVVEASIGHLV